VRDTAAGASTPSNAVLVSAMREWPRCCDVKMIQCVCAVGTATHLESPDVARRTYARGREPSRRAVELMASSAPAASQYPMMGLMLSPANGIGNAASRPNRNDTQR
jgi:hypothetical protein